MGLKDRIGMRILRKQWQNPEMQPLIEEMIREEIRNRKPDISPEDFERALAEALRRLEE